jgi:hypothetical protein
MDDDREAQRLLLELAAAAERAAISLRDLDRILRRIESIQLIHALETREALRAPRGGETPEGEIAEAAIARARGARTLE